MSAAIEGTYKDRDVEGLFDIYFYRKVGFAFARFFARLGMTPTAVTVLSGLCGVAAGHLYYYRDLRLNVAGMLLHVLSNTFDNADGQLARLTNRRSRNGRIIDSISDHIVFFGIYLHLTLRCLAEGASPWIWLLALAAGLSHGVQGGFADYFRNAYLFFVAGRARNELDSSATLREEYEQLSWRREPKEKLLLRIYLHFTLGQERFSPNLLRLRTAAWQAFPAAIPVSLRTRYRATAKPLFLWVGFLMTNTRMVVIFLALMLDRPAWYFVVEVTALNVILGYLLFRQRQICRSFLPEIEQGVPGAREKLAPAF